MIPTFEREVQQLAATMPACWKEQYKLVVARATVLANTMHRLDSAYDALLNDNMLRGRGGTNTMPPIDPDAEPLRLQW